MLVEVVAGATRLAEEALLELVELEVAVPLDNQQLRREPQIPEAEVVAAVPVMETHEQELLAALV
jgi:hypothetical protein